MDWCLYGEEKRREIDRDLKPEYLLDDLRRYQDVFGEEFGVKELLMLEDIRVKAMIAGALADTIPSCKRKRTRYPMMFLK